MTNVHVFIMSPLCPRDGLAGRMFIAKSPNKGKLLRIYNSGGNL